MPPRSQPTERQRRLGAELKKLRLSAGLSGDKAAEIIDADRQRISNIEAGRVDVPRNGLYQLLRAYNCPEGPLFEGLMAMAQDRGRGWWNEYNHLMERRALDLAELEARSARIHAHELMFIPGLLQTPDYTRAVLEAADEDPESIDEYVEFRVARQRILTAEGPTELHAVIHEAALHACVGDTDVMRRQLIHLIESARLPNVTIQVFPYSAGMYSAFSNTFTIFGGASPELDTVRVEQPVRTSVIHDGPELARYGDIFERLSRLALPSLDPAARPESNQGRDSLSFVQHLLYAL